jgi:predicted PurR-regulated permease PerM
MANPSPPDETGPIADVVNVLDDSPASPPPPGTTRIEIELPWRTILRVLLTLGFLWFIFATHEVLLQIMVGLLLAAALLPLVWRLERRGMRRGTSVVIVLLGSLAALVILVALIVPQLIEEAAHFWDNLPTYARDSLGFLETREPELYRRAISYVDTQTSDVSAADIDVEQAISGGMTVFGILAGAVAAIAVAAFTLTTGDETLRSLGRGLPVGQEEKVRRIVPEVIRVVSGYIVGQLINSTLFAVFTFALFTILDLPSPLVAAVIAFVLDAVPIVGATLATAIFAILALAQGTTETLIVIATCLIYQQFENYVTSPRVFGRTLRISPFVSLVAVLIGGKLMGIPGVLLGPPVAALISAAVRVWAEDIENITGPSGPRLSAPVVSGSMPQTLPSDPEPAPSGEDR